jgi:hypothetical protein
MMKVCLVLLVFLSTTSVAHSQEWEEDGSWERAVDSISTSWNKADSIYKADSLRMAIEFSKMKQFATMRTFDLTGDGKPETLRLEGKAKKNVHKVDLTFTISSGKKILYKHKWSAAGYFEDRDTLSEFTRMARLQRIVTVFFANENFSVLDSVNFHKLLQNVSVAEIEPASLHAQEVFQHPKIMYSVFHSRDLWYGLVWDEKRGKFIKAWTN